MHTLIVIAAGFGLLLACIGFGRVAGSAARGALTFLPVWFVGAAANMWVGVTQAGYSIAAELPIFGLVFGVPAVAAILARRALK